MAAVTETIDQIADIRHRNNALWMQLLKIALEHAPTETKGVLCQINENDTAISLLMRKLRE